jgi:tetratricopeptide (TPR) repeat protein
MWLIYFMNETRKWHTAFVLGALLLTLPIVLYAQNRSVGLTDDNRVAVYLSKAEQALAADRLTTPEDDNALAHVEQALALAPRNPQAIALLKLVFNQHGEQVNKGADTYHHAQRTNTRELAREVVISHVVLGERALDRGDIAKALRHSELAEELASQYGIDEENLKRLSLRIARMDLWWPSALYKLRIFGTF